MFFVSFLYKQPAALSDLENLASLYIDGNKFTGTIPNDLCRPELNSDFFENVPDTIERNFCNSVACPAGTAAFEGVYPCDPCDSSYFNPYLGRTGKCMDINQRDILDIVHESTSKADPWNGDDNWGDDDTFLCDFSGVTCDANSNVIAIQLKGRGLKGIIPEELGFLQYLEILDLSDNHLSGFLPSDLRWAPLQQLDISGNDMKGIVPPKLCLKSVVNGNGEGGDYNCERIACPTGTYSATGRDNGGSLCSPCSGNRAIGSKNCEAGAMGGSYYSSNQGISVSGVVALTVFLVGAVISMAFFLAMRLKQRKMIRGHEVPQEEGTINMSGFHRNSNAVSSLPYADDNETNSSITGSSFLGGKNMPPPPDPLYSGTFPNEDKRESIDRGRSQSGEDSAAVKQPNRALGGSRKNMSKNQRGQARATKNQTGQQQEGNEWNVEADSNKEVWLDVPEVE